MYYIDPYPSISEPQILTNNRDKDSMKLIQFNGVIGKSFVKLYEPFMAQKDEIKIILENSPKEYPKEVDWKKIFDSIQNEDLKNKLLNVLNEKELDEEKLKKLLK